jgi:hypothetical protein
MNSWIFFGAYVMLLHAMDTISTHGNIGFVQKFKIVLILRIKLPIDGHNRWTFFAYHLHFVLLLQKMNFKLTGRGRFYPLRLLG